MGSPASEPLRKTDESPQTRVTLTKGFWLGKTMVTIGQWKCVTGLGVRGQLSKMLHDDTLHDLGGKKQPCVTSCDSRVMPTPANSSPMRTITCRCISSVGMMRRSFAAG